MKVIGIADCRVSRDPEDSLVTYALGSCIAVIMHDPVARVGGVLHYMLPETSDKDERAQKNPYMFGSSGIPAMMAAMLQSGADRRRLVVRIAGGAQILSDSELFDIGRKNQITARKMLWKIGLLVKAEAVGGSVARTVRLHVGTGAVSLREGMKEVDFCSGATKTQAKETK